METWQGWASHRTDVCSTLSFNTLGSFQHVSCTEQEYFRFNDRQVTKFCVVLTLTESFQSSTCHYCCLKFKHHSSSQNALEALPQFIVDMVIMIETADQGKKCIIDHILANNLSDNADFYMYRCFKKAIIWYARCFETVLCPAKLTCLRIWRSIMQLCFELIQRFSVSGVGVWYLHQMLVHPFCEGLFLHPIPLVCKTQK